MKRLIAAVLVVFALATLVGCGASASSSSRAGYPGFGTPKATLDTFFTSRMKQDWETAWLAYYKHYSDKVTKEEFISHSKEDPTVLTAYKIQSVDQSGTTAASATVLLTFKTKSPQKPIQQTTVTEQLVNESGAWRIRVW